MTGYGTASYTGSGQSIHVEIRALNSKFLDLTLRLPKGLSSRELEVRKMVSDQLIRGKVILTVEFTDEGDVQMKQRYNEKLFIKYYQELRKLSDRVIDAGADLFTHALNAPDVIVSEADETISDENVDNIFRLIREAIAECNSFRVEEGASLRKELHGYVGEIGNRLEEVAKLDPKRVERIRARIKNNLAQFVDEEALDKNKLEQELVYYLEKLDITEEKVRLESHLNFFSEVLDDPAGSGKKLGFISQEMGREINTIGSKANDASIQKHVVVMKEELEKIKEQVLNIL